MNYKTKILIGILVFLFSSVIYAQDFNIVDILSQKPVFLFFYTDWCHFCQEQKPIIDALEEEYREEIAFIRINGEQNPQLMKEFGVEAFPAMFLIVDENEKGYLYQQFKEFTEKKELNDSITYALATGKARGTKAVHISFLAQHMRLLAEEEECPEGSEPRNCGGNPPKCDCFKWDGEKEEWVKIGERPIKPGDYLTVNTALDKDYKGPGTFYLDKDGMVFDGNGHTLDGITIYSDKNGVTIKNCVIINNWGNGIHLDGSNNSTIKDNTIKSCSYGVYLEDSSNCNVVDNTIHRVKQSRWYPSIGGFKQ